MLGFTYVNSVKHTTMKILQQANNSLSLSKSIYLSPLLIRPLQVVEFSNVEPALAFAQPQAFYFLFLSSFSDKKKKGHILSRFKNWRFLFFYPFGHLTSIKNASFSFPLPKLSSFSSNTQTLLLNKLTSSVRHQNQSSPDAPTSTKPMSEVLQGIYHSDTTASQRTSCVMSVSNMDMIWIPGEEVDELVLHSVYWNVFILDK